ncbi:hypothetical protein V5F53_18610 [Xanthobacter sp. V4C-4]|uniref:hypothetical protein n=1 Tax=Xanthobacter cornucopiae TaxID=3119924 RepID=UPI00372CC4A4
MNVTPMKRRARAERKLPLAHSPIHYPLAIQCTDKTLLGMLDHYDDHVVVRALTAEKE